MAGLADRSAALRELAVQLLDLKNKALRKSAAPRLAKLAAADSSVQVQAAALNALGSLNDKRYAPLFTKALGSKSYRVQAAALQGLLPLNPAQALARAAAFEKDNKGALTAAIVNVYGQTGAAAQWPSVLAKYDAADANNRFQMLPGLSEMLGRLDDATALAQGIGRIKDLTVQYKAFVDSERLIGLLRQILERQATRPNAALVAGQVEKAEGEIRAAK